MQKEENKIILKKEYKNIEELNFDLKKQKLVFEKHETVFNGGVRKVILSLPLKVGTL
jgi:hypothetical protein